MSERRIAIALRLDEPHPNHQDVFSGVRRYAAEHPGWAVVIDEHPGFEAPGLGKPEPALPYDGVIARAQHDTQARLQRMNIPLVNTLYAYADRGMPGVYLDVQRCGQVAAEHLVERGFRRLAYLDSGTYMQAKDIGRAFAEAAESKGHACTTHELEPGEYDNAKHWAAMRVSVGEFLDTLRPPVGLLVSLPWLARLVAGMCEQRNWHVPQQVAVICIDNLKNVVELSPQITCIDCNYEGIGYEAAVMLEQLISGKATGTPRLLVPPRGIITRESTDYFAVDDEVVAEALRYVSKNLSEKLTVDRIADEVAVSSRSLQRRFDRALGRAVSDEVRRLRLEMAKRLLSERKLAINRIAQMSGFNNSVIMGQIFQRELGMSPSAYRKRVLDG